MTKKSGTDRLDKRTKKTRPTRKVGRVFYFSMLLWLLIARSSCCLMTPKSGID